MPTQNKMTVLPLHYCDLQLNASINVAGDLMVENVEGLLRPENFDLWRDYISKKERDDLSATTIGVVHRFSSEEHIGKSEADSQDKIYKTFVLLRLMRPTRLQYSNIQLKLVDGEPDVFSVTHPGPLTLNVPHLQVFNRFHTEDLHLLRELLPKFLVFASSAPWHLTRAVRYFESGYSQTADPLLQFITWTIGIESFFSEDRSPVSDRDLVRKIEESLGARTDIFSEAEVALFPTYPTPLLVADMLPDLLEMRNHVVHGVRVPITFDERTTTSAATGEAVHYADVLREGASFILRKLILKAVAEANA